METFYYFYLPRFVHLSFKPTYKGWKPQYLELDFFSLP